MTPRSALIAAATSLLAACTAPDQRTDAPSSAPCAVNRTPIILTTPAGPGSEEIGGMTVLARRDGTTGALAIDTGSSLTFLYLGKSGPEYIPLAGHVTIGCEHFDLPGRNFEADPPEPGESRPAPIIGVLGADFLTTALTDFDPANLTITRYHEGSPPDTDTAAWTVVPYDNVMDHILIRITVDGQPRRLMWDTGSPHILLVGEEGRPGDRQSQAQDAIGGRFPMYQGTASISLGQGAAFRKPVLRAPRFPYFEGTVEALGGNLDGLAGQSLFGRRRIIVDPRAGVLRIAPDK